MAESRQAIKNRIRSVESTEKITRVMQLIASTELAKQRRHMEENREYANGLEECLEFAIQSTSESSIYLSSQEDYPCLYIVFTSDMGLCGSYNANILRLLQEKLQAEDEVIMIGSKGSTWAKTRSFKLKEALIDLNHDTAYETLSASVANALDAFEKGEFSKIVVLYTHFKNTLTYIPTLETILPVSKRKIRKKQCQNHFK